MKSLLRLRIQSFAQEMRARPPVDRGARRARPRGRGHLRGHSRAVEEAAPPEERGGVVAPRGHKVAVTVIPVTFARRGQQG